MNNQNGCENENAGLMAVFWFVPPSKRSLNASVDVDHLSAASAHANVRVSLSVRNG